MKRILSELSLLGASIILSPNKHSSVQHSEILSLILCVLCVLKYSSYFVVATFFFLSVASLFVHPLCCENSIAMGGGILVWLRG